jgi:hypothetical protein
MRKLIVVTLVIASFGLRAQDYANSFQFTQLKHTESISDGVILKLVEQLDCGDFEAEDIDDGFE